MLLYQHCSLKWGNLRKSFLAHLFFIDIMAHTSGGLEPVSSLICWRLNRQSCWICSLFSVRLTYAVHAAETVHSGVSISHTHTLHNLHFSLLTLHFALQIYSTQNVWLVNHTHYCYSMFFHIVTYPSIHKGVLFLSLFFAQAHSLLLRFWLCSGALKTHKNYLFVKVTCARNWLQ